MRNFKETKQQEAGHCSIGIQIIHNIFELREERRTLRYSTCITCATSLNMVCYIYVFGRKSMSTKQIRAVIATTIAKIQGTRILIEKKEI